MDIMGDFRKRHEEFGRGIDRDIKRHMNFLNILLVVSGVGFFGILFFVIGPQMQAAQLKEQADNVSFLRQCKVDGFKPTECQERLSAMRNGQSLSNAASAAATGVLLHGVGAVTR